jgi:methanogenic corrinoid protein MtbC1/transposase-like protein
MVSISDFSDEPKYTIKAVATKTGIRPVTLRAWERRHEVLTPHRAGNQYRLYSERDIAILRWLKGRVDNGVTISSAISELRTMTRSGQWPEAMPSGPATVVTTRSTIPPAQYAAKLYDALIRHDETRASDILREVHGSFDLMTICMSIITPAMHEIGEAWYRGQIRITTEHFASAFVRGKLLTLLQAYPSRRQMPSIMIGCAPTEQHEVGALMLAVLLRSEGYRVEYLGPDLPLEDLADYAGFEKPAMVILTSTRPESALEMKGFQAMLKKLRPAPIFGYGGNPFVGNLKLREQVPGNYLGDGFDIALENIGRLLEAKKN